MMLVGHFINSYSRVLGTLRNPELVHKINLSDISLRQEGDAGHMENENVAGSQNLTYIAGSRYRTNGRPRLISLSLKAQF